MYMCVCVCCVRAYVYLCACAWVVWVCTNACTQIIYISETSNTLQHTVTHCNTLQHTVTHCNTLQHNATHCNTLQMISLRRVMPIQLPTPGGVDLVKQVSVYVCVRERERERQCTDRLRDLYLYVHAYVSRFVNTPK